MRGVQEKEERGRSTGRRIKTLINLHENGISSGELEAPEFLIFSLAPVC